ncbi:MAG: serine/threonine-protein kinase, partial [Dokdonella sp.]
MAERLGMQALADAFELLLDMREGDRLSWLQEQDWCLPDKARLRRMLDADSNADACFMDAPALVHAQILDDDQAAQVEPQDLIGQQFGAFRIERLIGQGGMAAVFAARRVGADFDQLVAVKLLRRGLFSAVEQKLFRRERRLLANLSHPNIAHLIDGGVTEAGIPYLVLEFIEGTRLDHFVIEHRLSLCARLSLFANVCRAVEAAHQALIVHRDIKPSNILVTADGTPKLLDFGIAKLLLDETGEASHHTLTAALTPGYAAPEQLAGAQITTATDVYALGVILHELLTGQRPKREGASLASTVMDRQTTTAPGVLPLPAYQLRRALRGDLDNILARALSADPERRYPSATALIDDVERYLEGRAVRAHPPSRWYLLRKFVGRHRAPAAIVASLSLAVVGALAGALWQAQAARVEAQRANSVRDFVVDLFRTAEEASPRGQRATPEDVVEIGSKRVLENSELPAETRAELLGVLSTVAVSMGSEHQTAPLTEAWMELADHVYERNDPRWIESR